MSDPCPKCGGKLATQQIDNVLTKYCHRCGPLENGAHVKTGKAVKVGR